ncbi:MAG: hypothetical protein AAF919_01410 [Pseudomonadota bacterium]
MIPTGGHTSFKPAQMVDSRRTATLSSTFLSILGVAALAGIAMINLISNVLANMLVLFISATLFAIVAQSMTRDSHRVRLIRGT